MLMASSILADFRGAEHKKANDKRYYIDSNWNSGTSNINHLNISW